MAEVTTGLPAAAYTSPAVFDWEQRHLFAGSWSCVGRADELHVDGTTQRATTVGDVAVLLCRTPDGELVALANTCRHRGHELLGQGETSDHRAVVCPYHAWSYDLSGRLVAAPGFDALPTLDPDGLVRLPLEVWHGWVFVDALGVAPSFADHVGAMDGLVAPYAPENLVLRASHGYAVEANWKVLTENYHECYHCPLIHPELCEVSPPTSGRNFDLPGEWVGGVMDLREHAETMSFDGRSDGRRIRTVDPRSVLYLGLLPNLLVSLHPDYVMTHRLTPLSATRTEVECSWYFTDDDVDPAYAVEFWDRTNRQDWAACESVQRGLANPHYRPGPLAPNEDAVQRFVSKVARRYRDGGAPAGLS